MIGLFYRNEDKRSIDSREKIIDLLSKNHIDFIDLVLNSCDKRQALEKKVSLIIVFGGDGTVLSAAKLACSDIPIVAVNTGSVGFLTGYESNNLEELVSDIVNDRLVFAKRRLMCVTFNDSTYLALNDAVISKNHLADSASECVRLSLRIDGQFVDTYVGDGLILSTPTGSTAYAISAGGPIMVPEVEAYVAAPICAHSLHSRPIVFSQDSVARVDIGQNSKECALYIDGKLEASLKPGSIVKIQASSKYVSICLDSGKFFSRLSRKLNKWSKNDLLEVDHG